MKTPGITLLLILGLILGACGGDDSRPKTTASELQAGTCIAKEVDDEDDKAPDLESVVDCSEPHIFEILDVVDLPEDALSGKSEEERLANRKDLATLGNEEEEQSDENAAYYEFADPRCDQALREHAGYDDITVKGKSAEEIGLRPAFDDEVYTPWLNVMPERQWLEGKRQFICSVRYVEDSDADEPSAEPVSSPNNKMLISSASSASFPTELRACIDLDRRNDDVSLVGCDRSHTSENLFTFNGYVVFGEKAMASILKAKNPTDMQMAPLDRACTDSLPALMGDGYDMKKVTGKAYTIEFGDGSAAVECDLAAVDYRKNDLQAGSLAWTDATKAELINVE